MHTFALIKIDLIKGKINFYKLEIDGKCEFDEFCNDMKKSGDEGTIKSILANMDSIANNIRLPKTKYRELKGRQAGDKAKEFEFKKNAYRIYGFKLDNGNVVVFGGKKPTQKKDIERNRKIKKEYFNSQKL